MATAILLIWIGTRLGAPAGYYVVTGIMIAVDVYNVVKAAKEEK